MGGRTLVLGRDRAPITVVVLKQLLGLRGDRKLAPLEAGSTRWEQLLGPDDIAAHNVVEEQDVALVVRILNRRTVARAGKLVLSTRDGVQICEASNRIEHVLDDAAQRGGCVARV